MKLNKIFILAAMTCLPLQQAFSAPIEDVAVQVVDTGGGTSQVLLEKNADQVLYPLRLAVFWLLPVPKKSAAICAAFSLVMLFISISTPMVWFLRFSIWRAVFSVMVVSSVFVLVCFPFR